MSIEGVSNLKKQHNTIGEYSNPQLEELIEWINATVPVEASFAGPMPVMANLLLSTRRPIINHPHYEDAGLRERTKQVSILRLSILLQQGCGAFNNLEVMVVL